MDHERTIQDDAAQPTEPEAEIIRAKLLSIRSFLYINAKQACVVILMTSLYIYSYNLNNLLTQRSKNVYIHTSYIQNRPHRHKLLHTFVHKYITTFQPKEAEVGCIPARKEKHLNKLSKNSERNRILSYPRHGLLVHKRLEWSPTSEPSCYHHSYIHTYIHTDIYTLHTCIHVN